MKTSFWTKLLDLISPRICPGCGERLAPTEQQVCCVCRLHLPRTYYWLSPADNVMAQLFWGKAPIEKATAYFYYHPKSMPSRLVHALKYHQQPLMGETLGMLAASEFMPHGFFEGIDAMVPIPLSRSRERQRGYNQSMMIAQGIGRVTGLPIINKVVSRKHFKKSQTHIQHWERQGNVEGVFQLTDAEAVRGKHILLIDDVVTTGSTVLACMKALEEAGEVKFSLLSLGFTKS